MRWIGESVAIRLARLARLQPPWPGATRWLVRFTFAAMLTGCAFPRYYEGAEQSLHTVGHFAAQGHFAVYYPKEIALDFPGYVVGIEMSPRSAVLRDGDLRVERLRSSGRSIVRLIDELRWGRQNGDAPDDGVDLVPFVSHLIRHTGQPHGAGNCALYSVYQGTEPTLLDFCDGKAQPQIQDWSSYRSAFTDSWGAIDTLQAALQADAATRRYTHLLVMMMGWRTPQEEAIRNFNSIAHAITTHVGEAFRPLVIGVTWAAPWAGRWLDPLIESLAYGNIAELADRIGLTWVGVLTERVVLPLTDKLPATFITHSFGARAASTAICVGPAIRRQDEGARPPVEGAVDRLIGLGAAFSLQRFKPDPLIFFYEDVYFVDDCPRAKSIVLTASQHDSAARAILWADLAANRRYYDSFCRSNSSALVTCASVDETGAIVGEVDPSMKVLYLDATPLIRYRAPGTDGGAHSDIFRPPMGRLLWSLMATRPAAVARPAARVPAALE